jgi:N-acetylglucosaminyldiphosphoundecaprenol N-acetyl-beta-D-mannosaminyltransferase
MGILVNYIIFFALGLSPSFTAALFLLVVLQVGIAVPSAPGKLGIFQYLCILALAPFGVGKSNALIYSVLLYLVAFGPHESRYVCVANVHMLMEAYDSPEFQNVVNAADLVTPDGMPLVWMLRHLGYLQQERVYGPDLTLKLIEAIVLQEICIGFYGGTAETLAKLMASFKERYPNLKIVYSFSPPFHQLTDEENETVIREVNASGAKILFVGLGCPKQERWMAAQKDKIQAVMIGVGAAFDIHARNKSQAPLWMQRSGLEWIFRLLQEPIRLWRRYLYHNPRFMVLALMQLSGLRTFGT